MERYVLPCGDERSAEAIAEYERRLERQLRATALTATPRVNSTPFERRRDNIALFSMYNATRAWHQLHPGWKKNHNGVECDCTLLRAQGLPPTGAGAAPRGTPTCPSHESSLPPTLTSRSAAFVCLISNMPQI